MKKEMVCFVVIWCLVWTVGINLFSWASAETGYVSDMLILTMRDGPGKGYAVLNSLRSNMALEILETQDNFYRVRTENGQEGWVASQYITFDIPMTMTIAQLEKKIETLEQENQRMAQEKDPFQKSMETLRKENSAAIKELKLALKNETLEKKRVTAEYDAVRKEYEQLKNDSKNTIQILEENKVLKNTLVTIQSDIDTLKAENKSALKTGMIKWFLGGAAVLFLGWIIGRSFTGRKRGSGSLLN